MIIPPPVRGKRLIHWAVKIRNSVSSQHSQLPQVKWWANNGVTGTRLAHSNTEIHKMLLMPTLSCHKCIKLKARNTPFRVPGAVSLWHKRTGNSKHDDEEHNSTVSQCEWSTLMEGQEGTNMEVSQPAVLRTLNHSSLDNFPSPSLSARVKILRIWREEI